MTLQVKREGLAMGTMTDVPMFLPMVEGAGLSPETRMGGSE